MFVEWSVNVMLCFLAGLSGSQLKSAIGAMQDPPIEGLALGATLALAEGLGLPDGEPDGLDDGDGEGDGVGLGAGGGVGGSSRGIEIAVEDRSIVWPPVNIASSGVTRLNCPVTVIAIV